MRNGGHGKGHSHFDWRRLISICMECVCACRQSVKESDHIGQANLSALVISGTGGQMGNACSGDTLLRLADRPPVAFAGDTEGRKKIH